MRPLEFDGEVRDTSGRLGQRKVCIRGGAELTRIDRETSRELGCHWLELAETTPRVCHIEAPTRDALRKASVARVATSSTMTGVFRHAAVPHRPISGATGKGEIARIQSGEIFGPAFGQSFFSVWIYQQDHRFLMALPDNQWRRTAD